MLTALATRSLAKDEPDDDQPQKLAVGLAASYTVGDVTAPVVLRYEAVPEMLLKAGEAPTRVCPSKAGAANGAARSKFYGPASTSSRPTLAASWTYRSMASRC